MVTYTLDGYNLYTHWGVRVSKTTGLVGRPEYKTPFTMDWSDKDGTWIDLGHRKRKNRNIVIECWVKHNNEILAWQTFENFIKYWSKDRLLRLVISFAGQAKSLIYQVYLDKSEVTYKWRRGDNIIKFKLSLIEPEPVKAVITAGIVPVSLGGNEVIAHVMPTVIAQSRESDKTYLRLQYSLLLSTLVDGNDMGYRINVSLPDGTTTGDVATYSGSFLYQVNTNEVCDIIVTGDIEHLYFDTLRITLSGIRSGYELYKELVSDEDTLGGFGV